MSSNALFVDAMRAQPKNLALAHSTLTRDLQRARLVEWKPGDTVAVVAMGASSHTGNAFVAVLAEAGFRAVNLTASDVLLAADGFQPADHYVIVSESGRSPETIEAARRLTVGRRIGISNFPEAQIGGVIDAPISLGGFNDSPVYTIGYTATLLAYALLLDRVGKVPAGPEVERIPAIVGNALNAYDSIATRISRFVADASAIDVIGRGTSFASAAETSLMIREGLRIPSGSYETFQYLHGPMESAAEGSVLIIFGDGRELTIPDSVLDSGVQVILVTAAPESAIPSAGHANLTIVPLAPGLGGFVRPIVEIVFAQLLLAHAIDRKPFLIEKFIYEQHDTKVEEVIVAERV
ncbi:SIS domain-containing protein [Cryobacterium tagatosivorans]|uniref:SIS domain-containing protein n=1 Tax=Cryobacterium tagatosivorans TaxID=1259199 RepID=A0A4R8UHX3_9MICO|nr:SIS domain-containing protein [Cryobacterium tagatosivorans]TFB56701.1 SIS domain-containing protein [Cryobacterium tagatosivorans]